MNRQWQQQASSLPFHYNSFISSSSLQLHSRHYTGAKQTSLFLFQPWLLAGHGNEDDCWPNRIPQSDNSNNDNNSERPFTASNSFISSSSLQLHSRYYYTGAKQTSLFGFQPWQQQATQQTCRTPVMSDAGYVSNSNN